jgi:UDP-N-acetylglucosamine 2-epimerase (non-hydrolysing)
MKIAPVVHAMSAYPGVFDQYLVHTGQHYDHQMSQIFFDELELPRPDVNLEVGSGTHTWQTAQVMLAFEPVVQSYRPDWVVVVGDVNSTLACALVSSRLGVPVAHVEAGLRSFDRSMPEETNRILTDQVADLLFTPSEDGDRNLLHEGIEPGKIRLVGNVMIDTLLRLLPKAQVHWLEMRPDLKLDRYVLVTLHRHFNVDDPQTLTEILAALIDISQELPVLFPVHPRTSQRLADFGLGKHLGNVILLEPLGYLDFLAMQIHASLVLTDSGGIQEETTFLGIPCLTVRPNTERPVTITQGTNQLVASQRRALVSAIRERLTAGKKTGSVPPLWDGRAAERIVACFRKFAGARA